MTSPIDASDTNPPPPPAAQFSQREIELARQMRPAIVDRWTPAAGHFVMDENAMIERGSPFQNGVYFILNYDHFVKLAGGIEGIKAAMTWLPTWPQARRLARQLEIDDSRLIEHCLAPEIIAAEGERAALYELLLTQMK